MKKKLAYLMTPGPNDPKTPPERGLPDPGTQLPLQPRANMELFYNMLLPACDLASTTKPWKFSKETAEVVYMEFFEQGDVEKSMGRAVAETFDRSKRDHIAAMQVGFIDFVVQPVFQHLCKLFLPKAQFMLDELLRTKAQWKALDDEAKKKNAEEDAAKALITGSSAAGSAKV